MPDGIRLNKGYDGDLLAAWLHEDEAQKYQLFINAQKGPVREILSRYLDVAGDGSGATLVNVDGSVTPVVRQIVPGVAEIVRISQLTLVLSSSAAFDSSKFASLTALTNGIDIVAHVFGVDYRLDGGANIKNTVQLTSVFPRAGYFVFGTTFMGIFVKDFLPQPVRLKGFDGDFLSLTVRDNLSTLGASYVSVQGVWEEV